MEFRSLDERLHTYEPYRHNYQPFPRAYSPDYGQYRLPEDDSLPLPFHAIERVPPHLLGNGVLGRCYTGQSRIQIRDDLYGRLFSEVFLHERLHSLNPNLSEKQVRLWTKYQAEEPH